MSDSSDATPARAGTFATTHWTRVLASRGEGAEAREALSALCGAYYPPVVAVLRHEGRPDDEARELAHAFFERILSGKGVQGADPLRGRFRSYLLGALKHFLVNQRTREGRLRRGGAAVHVSWNATDPSEETSWQMEPAGDPAPEDAVFDRAWAHRVLEHGLNRLEAEWRAAGAAREFELLKPWLGGEGERAAVERATVEREMGWSETAFRTALHRLRRRFRVLIKAEIAATVWDTSDVDGELEYLIRALSVAPTH